jgi:hypothetical protein
MLRPIVASLVAEWFQQVVPHFGPQTVPAWIYRSGNNSPRKQGIQKATLRGKLFGESLIAPRAGIVPTIANGANFGIIRPATK